MNIAYKTIKIRNAEISDCKQLAFWWNDGSVMAHAGYPNGLGISEEEIKNQIATDDDKSKRRLIIEVENQPVGEMSFYVYEDSKYEIGIKNCQKEFQNKGLGKIILSLFIENLISKGARLIFLDTNLNNLRAQHVYESLGFKKTGIRKNACQNQNGEWQSFVDYELKPEDFNNMKDGYFIRLAEKSDLAEILQVINDSYNSFDVSASVQKPVYSLSELEQILLNPKNRMWVAVASGKIAGVSAGCEFSPKCFHLKLLFVSSQNQNSGIGEKLLKSFEDYGKSAGYEIFTTNYLKWAHWSGKFYKKHGFKEYVSGDEKINAELFNQIVMRKKNGTLNNGDKCFIWKTEKKQL